MTFPKQLPTSIVICASGSEIDEKISSLHKYEEEYGISGETCLFAHNQNPIQYSIGASVN
jgi:hypothetical protein